MAKKASKKSLFIAWEHAWKEQQQLAQQRFAHFNIFLVFMTASFGVYFQQIATDKLGNGIALCIAVVQIFLTVIFKKFDQRNYNLKEIVEKRISKIEGSIGIDFAHTSSDKDVNNDAKGCFFCKEYTANMLYSRVYGFFIATTFIAFLYPAHFLLCYCCY